jgi:hypothetical protein
VGSRRSWCVPTGMIVSIGLASLPSIWSGFDAIILDSDCRRDIPDTQSPHRGRVIDNCRPRATI